MYKPIVRKTVSTGYYYRVKIEGYQYEKVLEHNGVSLWQSTRNPYSLAVRPFCSGGILSTLLTTYLMEHETNEVYWSEQGYPYRLVQFAYVVRLTASGSWLTAGLKGLLGREDVGLIQQYGPMRMFLSEHINYDSLHENQAREVGS